MDIPNDALLNKLDAKVDALLEAVHELKADHAELKVHLDYSQLADNEHRGRVDKVENRVGNVESKLDQIDGEQAMVKWIIGGLGALGAIGAAVIMIWK